MSDTNINTNSEVSGVVYGNVGVGETTYEMNKFHAQQGHGFAAERAEHIVDLVQGKDAQILGDNNAKDGADRLVNGVEIQSKYCQSGSACIQACFEDGKYRYISSNGEPMQVEVPSDMYDDAVQAMRRRIESNEVEGITNPDDAEKLVKKGHFTYEQAKKIARAGTVESLTFDAANGMIISANAMGISAAISLALSLWDGEDIDTALENAALSGIKVGGVAFLSTIVTSQIARTSLNSTVRLGTDFIVQKLGTKASSIIASSLRGGTNIYGAAAMNNVSKLLAGNIIASAVSLVVLSAKDIVDLFRGRISGAQFGKNLAVTGATIAGGNAGWVAGNAAGAAIGGAVAGVLTGGVGTAAGANVGSKIGGFVGSIAGGAASGKLTQTALNSAVKDDYTLMLGIIEEEYTTICEEYLLTQNEVYDTLTLLKDKLTPDEIKSMYASSNRSEYARKVIMQCVEPVLEMRKVVTDEDMRDILRGVRLLVEDAADGTGIFDTSEALPTISEVQENLLVDRNVRNDQVYEIMKPVIELNRTQKRVERSLYSMKRDNEETSLKREALKNERDNMKNELKSLLDN